MLENQAMIDTLLGGRYRIVTTLGSGGFSKTYVAEDTHRPGNPKCAVKHLQPAKNNQNFLESARRLFNSEAETLEKLGSHDRIPRLLAYFEENHEFYLVQEFIPGELLTHRLQPHQPWTENQVWEFIQEILEILVFIHSQGFIHRDIKPSNIIQRQQDNKLVLVDFGAVKQNWTELLSQTANIAMPATIGIGTPGYMPMEQARGRPRPSSDIYALGAIAVQALTGLYPMQLEEDLETGELLWRQKAQVSDELASIITKMVRYHFKDRYETATEALAEVQQLSPLYLTTEIGNELQSPANFNLVPPVARLNQPPQDAVSTNIITPTLPISDPVINSLATDTAAPNTTIVSPLKPPQPPLASPRGRRRPYYLTLGATFGAALLALGAGAYALYWQPRLQLEQTLEQIENFKATGNYSECIVRAATIPQNSSVYTDAQNVLYECQLIEAKKLATKGDFKGAIALAQKIPSNSLVYPQAQATLKQWLEVVAKNNADLVAAKSLSKKVSEPKPIAKPVVAKSKPTTNTATKKVVRRSPTVVKTITKPKTYTRKASAPTRRITPTVSKAPAKRSAPTRRITPTVSKAPAKRSAPTRRITPTVSKAPAKRSAPTRRITPTVSKAPARRSAPTRRVSTTTARIRSTSRITKKTPIRSSVRAQAKRVLRRVTSKPKTNRSSQSYKWTTKTIP